MLANEHDGSKASPTLDRFWDCPSGENADVQFVEELLELT